MRYEFIGGDLSLQYVLPVARDQTGIPTSLGSLEELETVPQRQAFFHAMVLEADDTPSLDMLWLYVHQAAMWRLSVRIAGGVRVRVRVRVRRVVGIPA